ncbi:VWA domain-containing protein, partial [Candidatus Sumerlaeota bacterium]|nr:VWA domain-containing protein [Candidatus Sumerlaeota bacterium]
YQPQRQTGDLMPGPTAWVVIVDDSYSMGQVSEGLTTFDRAVAAAAEILKMIPERDDLLVLLTSERRPEGLNVTTYRSAAAIEALRRLEGPSFGDAAVASAVEQGLRFLEQAKVVNRVLVLISDFQDRALNNAVEMLASRKSLPQGGAICWLDVGQPPQGNTAVQAVRAYQPLPFVGLPMRIQATVANCGERPARQTASLWINGSKTESQEVEIAPGGISEVEFQHVPIEAGNIAGEARIEGDPLPADNHRFFSWHVTTQIRAVVVHGGSGAKGESGEARWDDVFFLKSAFEPVVGGANREQSRGLRVEYVGIADVAKISWSHYQVAFLAGLDRLPDDLAGQAEQFVRRGGCVVAFGGTGDSAIRQSQPDNPDVKLLGIAPGDIGTDALESTRTLKLGQLDEQHPILRTLSQTAAQNLSAVEFYTYRRLRQAALDSASRVIASYDSGDPFLVERRLGNGRILVFTTRCHPDWTNLPVRPLFLPLLYETMKYCVAGQFGLQGDLAPGAPLRISPPEGKRIARAIDPEGKTISCPTGEGRRAPSAEKPGVYRIFLQSGDGETELLVAVNVNPEEGKIVRLDRDEVAKKLEPAHVGVFGSASQLTGLLRRQREGVPLRSFLLYLAVFCFLTESFLANYLIPRGERPAGEK